MRTNMEGGDLYPPKPGVPAPVADPWMYAIPNLVTAPPPPVSITPPPTTVTSAPPPVPVPWVAPTFSLPTTNFADLILNSPEHMNAVRNASLASQSQLAGNVGNIRAALVALGFHPNSAALGNSLASLTPEQRAQFMAAFDPATFAAADENQHSIAKQLLQAYQNNLTAERNNFEDRGFADSGFRNAEDANQGNIYEGGVQNAITQFLNYVAGQASDFAGGEYQRGQDIFGADNTARGRLQNDPNIGPGGGEAALVDPKGGPGGEPVYKGPDGRMWVVRADGSVVPYAPPTPPDLGSIFGPGANTSSLYTDPDTGTIRKKGAVL